MSDREYITIPLSKGYSAIVDHQDSDIANHHWHSVVDNRRAGEFKVSAARTIRINERRVTQYMHRVIMERVLQRPLLSSEHVDHVNLNPADNRRDNLRLATPAQNQWNQAKPKRNTSGYKGVTFYKQTGKWMAQIYHNKHHKSLGYFSTPEEAYEAYCKAAIELHGQFARLK